MESNKHLGKPDILTDITELEVLGFEPNKTKATANANSKRPFVFWDGEATVDGGYCLFGNSDGWEIQGRNLSTIDMLEFMLLYAKTNKRSFNIAFVFDYDVNNILKDLPWTALIMLRERGRCVWKGYKISHNPGKRFRVSKNGISLRIDDVFSFFRTAFLKALYKYKIGTVETRFRIAQGKSSRDRFAYSDIDYIRSYWTLEGEAGVELMNRIRRDVNAGGFFIGEWHGPGALASYALNKHGVRRHMQTEYNPELSLAVRTAYAGGWFERFKAGVYYGPVYTADINSAYAYAFSELPDLSNGVWERIESPNPKISQSVRCGIFHIRYAPTNKFGQTSRYFASGHGVPLPLFLRGDNGGIFHPVVLDGWYWQDEAALVSNDPNAVFVEAWVLKDDGTYPFEWMADYYQMRLALQAENNPAELPYKWVMASAYGQVARRIGWNHRTRKAPAFHQLEWAGSITSRCRMMVYHAAQIAARRGGLVSIDTDGIISTTPFNTNPGLPNGVGNQLGRWKVEEFTGIVYIQNGFYWLRDKHGNWKPPKTRGIPATKLANPDKAIAALEKDGEIVLNRHTFVGYGAAIRGRRDAWRTWVDSPYHIAINGGSRRHIDKFCRICRTGNTSLTAGLHDLMPVPPINTESAPHKLPWLEESKDAEFAQRMREEIDRMYAL
jgi:hypothetical protein